MKDLLLFPCSGNAREAIAVIDAINAITPTWNVLGFIDDNKTLKGSNFCGYPVLGGKELLKKYPSAKVLAVPGRPETYWRRDKIIASLELPPGRFATLIHPKAQIAPDTKIGYNTLLMAGVTSTANVKIGNHCVVLPNTVLSHDVKVGSYSLIGSNVSISGSVNVQKLCYIGSGAKIIQEIELGTGSLVGLGSVVLGSTKPYSIVAGNPAKFLRYVKS